MTAGRIEERANETVRDPERHDQGEYYDAHDGQQTPSKPGIDIFYARTQINHPFSVGFLGVLPKIEGPVYVEIFVVK